MRCTESEEPGPTDARASATRIRAIYFVTDTATWGVATPPLICAVKRIREQLSGVRSAGTNSCASSKVQVPPARVPIGLLKYPGNCSIEGQPNTLVLLGPWFSGAMDSVGQQLDKLLGPEIDGVVPGIGLHNRGFEPARDGAGTGSSTMSGWR